jgi:hypothetical protein
MDVTLLLLADAIGLMIATSVLSYFFLRDLLQKGSNKK